MQGEFGRWKPATFYNLNNPLRCHLKLSVSSGQPLKASVLIFMKLHESRVDYIKVKFCGLQKML